MERESKPSTQRGQGPRVKKLAFAVWGWEGGVGSLSGVGGRSGDQLEVKGKGESLRILCAAL